MFDIGFQELLLVAIVALLVLGPERLPGALRTMGLWMGRMRRSFNAVKNEIEREIGMDEIRRQLHNEAVMEELKRIERDVRATTTAAAGRSEPAAAPATELEMGAPREAEASGLATPDGPAPEQHASRADDAPASPTPSTVDGPGARSGAGQHG